MGTSSWIHWVAVLAVVILVFGTGKLRNIGKDLGGAIKGFKEGVKDTPSAASSTDTPKDGKTIDVQATEKK